MSTTYVGYIGDHEPNDLQIRQLYTQLALLDLKEHINFVCDFRKGRWAASAASNLGILAIDSTDFSKCSIILGMPKNKRSRDRIIRKPVWDQLRDFSKQGKDVIVLYHEPSSTLREFERP